MNQRMITRNLAAYSEIGFLIKLILKPYGRVATMPTAWELTPRRPIRKVTPKRPIGRVRPFR